MQSCNSNVITNHIAYTHRVRYVVICVFVCVLQLWVCGCEESLCGRGEAVLGALPGCGVSV